MASPLALPLDEVHVWRVPLDAPPDVLRFCRAALSPDERERAARFKVPGLEDRFTLARGALRDVLARYLGIAPAEVAFRYAARGKPFLDVTWLRFNLSHSNTRALVAVARDRDLGVDIERIEPSRATGGIAQRFFAPAEVGALMRLPEDQRVHGFFNCWSRKESYIKALGEGLYAGLDAFEVSLDSPACLLATRVPGDRADRWDLRGLEMEAGYTAAVCVEGDDWKLREFDYKPL